MRCTHIGSTFARRFALGIRRTFRTLPTRSSFSYLYQAVRVDRPWVCVLIDFIWTWPSLCLLLYRLWPAALDVVQFVSASPGLPVRNGILKVCHRPEPPFLRILPARLFLTACQKPSAFCLSFLDLLRCFSAVSFKSCRLVFLCENFASPFFLQSSFSKNFRFFGISFLFWDPFLILTVTENLLKDFLFRSASGKRSFGIAEIPSEIDLFLKRKVCFQVEDRSRFGEPWVLLLRKKPCQEFDLKPLEKMFKTLVRTFWEAGSWSSCTPYFRLFSFCDYTIPPRKGAVYSQSRQACKDLFVHI